MAWLPLMEFANKFEISVSTLRRRIRARAITYKIVDGKYLILEEEEDVNNNQAPLQEKNNPPISPNKNSLSGSDGFQNFFQDAQKMLDEIKKAYTLILQEKEEQICELKDEISDLRTLVRVLETENERLKSRESK